MILTNTILDFFNDYKDSGFMEHFLRNNFCVSRLLNNPQTDKEILDAFNLENLVTISKTNKDLKKFLYSLAGYGEDEDDISQNVYNHISILRMSFIHMHDEFKDIYSHFNDIRCEEKVSGHRFYTIEHKKATLHIIRQNWSFYSTIQYIDYGNKKLYIGMDFSFPKLMSILRNLDDYQYADREFFELLVY